MYLQSITQDLIFEFVKTKEEDRDVTGINEYRLNGDTIEAEYSYDPHYEWEKDKEDRTRNCYKQIRINLLDYISFIFKKLQTRK